MRTYLPPECGYTIEGNRIVTDGTVRKKVSGTSMAGILNVSPFTSPFQIACSLLGLAREDISGKPAVKVGQILEEPIVRYAGRTYPEYGTFCTAEEVFEKREGDHDSWVSDFEDDIFAGHVDGIVFKDNGEGYVLEIKTSRNLDSWTEGVPEYYRLQVELYNHFVCKKDKAYVVLGMVDENTYKDANSWIANKNTVAMFEMDIDDNFEETLDRVREWYKEYVCNNTTPEYDPNNPGDVEMFNHLQDLTRTIDEVTVDVDRYHVVLDRISEAEESIRGLYDEREMLKAQLKDYMSTHQLSSMNTSDGSYKVSLSIRVTKVLDEKKMVEDGIDLDKYRVDKVSKSITMKNNKKK